MRWERTHEEHIAKPTTPHVPVPVLWHKKAQCVCAHPSMHACTHTQMIFQKIFELHQLQSLTLVRSHICEAVRVGCRSHPGSEKQQGGLFCSWFSDTRWIFASPLTSLPSVSSLTQIFSTHCLELNHSVDQTCQEMCILTGLDFPREDYQALAYLIFLSNSPIMHCFIHTHSWTRSENPNPAVSLLFTLQLLSASDFVLEDESVRRLLQLSEDGTL